MESALAGRRLRKSPRAGRLRGQRLGRQITGLLRALNLELALSLAGEPDLEPNWNTRLSQRDRLMLCFVRLRLAQPRFVFLDGVAAILGPGSARMILFEEPSQWPAQAVMGAIRMDGVNCEWSPRWMLRTPGQGGEDALATAREGLVCPRVLT